MSWHYDRLPKYELIRVSDALDNRRYDILIEIHNEHKLSPYDYNCCRGDKIEGLIKHFEWIRKQRYRN